MRLVVHSESILLFGGALLLCSASVWASDDVGGPFANSRGAVPATDARQTSSSTLLTSAASETPGAVPASPYGPPGGEQAPEPSPAPPPPPAYGPPLTLLDPARDYAISGMGGVTVAYTRLAGNNAALVCGEGAVILDHAVTFGGGGCGLVTQIDASRYGDPPHDPNDRLAFGYGGAIVRYHLFARKVTNLAVGGLLGAGGVSIERWNPASEKWESDHAGKRTEAVFVVEPQVSGFINVTRWLRLGAGVGYRLVAGVETKGLSSQDLSGPTAGLHVQAGWF